MTRSYGSGRVRSSAWRISTLREFSNTLAHERKTSSHAIVVHPPLSLRFVVSGVLAEGPPSYGGNQKNGVAADTDLRTDGRYLDLLTPVFRCELLASAFGF